MAKAKKIEGLNCHANAAADVRLVLGTRLGEMCELRAAALEESASKGVHDMRVASRRLRSAVRDFKPYLRRRKLADAADELKRVADALGRVRDEDVAIEALEELQQEAPAEVAAGIAVLTDERRDQREAARAALTKAITEEKLAQLQTDFVHALERATAPRRRRRNKKKSTANLSFRELGSEVIRARLAELRALSNCLYEPFEPDGLHEMRIAAKRLRYAMELFAACWGVALAEQATEVAELQTSLGELHDCDVWIQGFGELLREWQEQEASKDKAAGGRIEAPPRSAAIWLLRHFAKARMKHFGNALALWNQWEARAFFTQLRDTLNASVPGLELSSAATLSPADAVAADIATREQS